MDSGEFGTGDSGSERSRIQCSEHGSGILVDDSEQSASRRFRGPPRRVSTTLRHMILEFTEV